MILCSGRLIAASRKCDRPTPSRITPKQSCQLQTAVRRAPEYSYYDSEATTSSLKGASTLRTPIGLLVVLRLAAYLQAYLQSLPTPPTLPAVLSTYSISTVTSHRERPLMHWLAVQRSPILSMCCHATARTARRPVQLQPRSHPKRSRIWACTRSSPIKLLAGVGCCCCGSLDIISATSHAGLRLLMFLCCTRRQSRSA